MIGVTHFARSTVLVALALTGVLPPAAVAAQHAQEPGRTGAQIYQDTCAACHAPDGRGMPKAVVGFDVPLPDFTDCLFATVEAAPGWETVVRDGGPTRALDRHMPAFGGVLSQAEIRLVVSHVRTFCADLPDWPQGDLNLPRALVTEKAFPENETLVTTAFGTGHGKAITNALLYERRFGARSMVEAEVPFSEQQLGPGSGSGSSSWAHGLGDVTVSLKRAMYQDTHSGTIFSVGGELALPTGKEALGLGSGITTLEPFIAFGQRFPHDSFLQFHGGVGLPLKAGSPNEAFWRTAIGRQFMSPHGGHSLVPMLEVVASHAFEVGGTTEWDVVPQMQVSLSRRRHILVSGGVQVPVSERDGRHLQVLTYFLWDWYEGGLFDGWR